MISFDFVGILLGYYCNRKDLLFAGVRMLGFGVIVMRAWVCLGFRYTG